MSELLEPAALEHLAIETFARVRAEHDGVLGTRGALRYDLEIVPGQARAGTYGVAMTVRMIVWDGDSIRDIKEQELWLVPGDLDDDRVPAFLEGVARGVARLAATDVDLDTLMPHELVPFRAARDPDCQTAEQFAERAGEQEPEVALAVDDLSGTLAIAQNPDLERAIDEDPERVDTYLVYADWLTEHGDPRGEFISCSVPDAPPTAKRRAAQLLARNERYFAGPFMSSDRMAQFVELSWKLGYFDELRIAADYDLFNELPDFAARALRGIMSLASSRFIRGLTFGCINFAGECNFDTLYPILVDAGPRPSMRTLFIGDTTSEEQELSWTRAGDLAALRGLYPNLRMLRVHAGPMHLVDALTYPALEVLAIQTDSIAAENVRAIAAAELPALRDLEVWLGPGNSATSTIDDLHPILTGDRLPALTRLALRNCEYTDDICRAIATAHILPRLRELDLSMGIMTDAGVEALLAHRGVLAHLSKLDVSDNYLTNEGLSALGLLGIEVTSSHQKSGDVDSRYVTVSE